MEACEFCSGYNAVMWSLADGHICLSCEEKRRAAARQKDIDERAAAEQAERDRYKFWHE